MIDVRDVCTLDMFVTTRLSSYTFTTCVTEFVTSA